MFQSNLILESKNPWKIHASSKGTPRRRATRPDLSRWILWGRLTEPKIMARKADGDLDRRPEIVTELGQELMVYTALNYFFF